jgi:hypothetical protein
MPKQTKHSALCNLLETTSFKALSAKAKNLVKNDRHLVWNDSVKIILQTISEDPSQLAPKIEPSKAEPDVLKKWLKSYAEGFANRISERVSNKPGTVADPIINTIISCRLPLLGEENLKKISFGHRLSMSAENILGHLLEEYLAVELKPHKWHCCWGETVKNVDFINENGSLLQVKNRSNSENAAGKTVRSGTTIKIWCRVKATNGEYFWEDLNTLHEDLQLTEEKFEAFVVKTINANKEAMPVEEKNPWKEVNGSRIKSPKVSK